MLKRRDINVNRRILVRYVLALGLLATGGCGAVPDFVVESARTAAIEAVDNAVSEIVDDAIQRLFEASDLIPLSGADEPEPPPE